MRRSKGRIPGEVFKEIFPHKLSRFQSSEQVYTRLKKMIVSGKFKEGKKLIQEEIAHAFSVSRTPVKVAYSRLEKDGLIIIKGRAGAFITRRFKKPR